jgi:nucleoside-diphosphate-sugar epimerase
MRVFVAGAGGYLGIPLCHKLAAIGHEVIAFDRYFFGKKPHGDRITVVTGDIRLVTKRDIAGCDAVIDLAGLSNDASCEIDPANTKNINVDGALHLIQTANRASVSRYVYSSSASVYGHGEKDNLTEDGPVNPLTEYAESKLTVEKFLRSFQENFTTMHRVILRNATVFGLAPRMRFDLAINAMVARALLEGSIYVMGGGSQFRPFIHVDDAVGALIWAMEEAPRLSGETFNVGCQGNQMSIRAVAGRIANTFHGVKIHMIPDNPDERSYHLSFDKMKKVRPNARFITIESGAWEVRNALVNGKISFTDSTTMTVQWYKSIIEWNQRLEELKCGGPVL